MKYIPKIGDFVEIYSKNDQNIKKWKSIYLIKSNDEDIKIISIKKLKLVYNILLCSEYWDIPTEVFVEFALSDIDNDINNIKNIDHDIIITKSCENIELKKISSYKSRLFVKNIKSNISNLLTNNKIKKLKVAANEYKREYFDPNNNKNSYVELLLKKYPNNKKN